MLVKHQVKPQPLAGVGDGRTGESRPLAGGGDEGTPISSDSPALQDTVLAKGSFSAPWVKNPNTEKVVIAWAAETEASAPPRHQLDFAEHMRICLPALIKALG